MAQRNNALGGQETPADTFDNKLDELIAEYDGVMFYHELIGVLQMHATRLSLEAHGVFDLMDEEEEEDEDDDDDWGNFLPDL